MGAATYRLSKKNKALLRELVIREYFRDKHEAMNHILFTYFDSKEFFDKFQVTYIPKRTRIKEETEE